jgi:DNA-binding Xre family transcriptional regulator
VGLASWISPRVLFSIPKSKCLFTQRTRRKASFSTTLKACWRVRKLSSFALSKEADLSPTTTRKICGDTGYIPSPDVLEKICLTLECAPGDVLGIRSTMESAVAVGSGVFCC